MPLLPRGRLIFARRRSDNTLVGVLDVENGLRCDCLCPDCGLALIANQGRFRCHFSHSNGSRCFGMGVWHTAIRDSIASLSWIDFGPKTLVPRLGGRHRVIRGTAEAAVLGDEFRLDVLLELQSGFRVAVEVVDSNDIAGIKFLALQQECYQVLRIDVPAIRASMRGVPATADNLRSVVASFGGWQSWPTISAQAFQWPLALTRGRSNSFACNLMKWLGFELEFD
jgi:hypothetical protein